MEEVVRFHRASMEWTFFLDLPLHFRARALENLFPARGKRADRPHRSLERQRRRRFASVPYSCHVGFIAFRSVFVEVSHRCLMVKHLWEVRTYYSIFVSCVPPPLLSWCSPTPFGVPTAPSRIGAPSSRDLRSSSRHEGCRASVVGARGVECRRRHGAPASLGLQHLTPSGMAPRFALRLVHLPRN
jgi:hypothetical protein